MSVRSVEMNRAAAGNGEQAQTPAGAGRAASSDWLTRDECDRISRRQSLREGWKQSGMLFLVFMQIYTGVLCMTPPPSEWVHRYGRDVALLSVALFGVVLIGLMRYGRSSRRSAYWRWMRHLLRPDARGLRCRTAPGRYFEVGPRACIGIHPSRAVIIRAPFVIEVERLDEAWKLIVRTANPDKHGEGHLEEGGYHFLQKDRSQAETFSIPRRHLAAVVDQLLTMSADPTLAKVYWCEGVLGAVKDELPHVRARRAATVSDGPVAAAADDTHSAAGAAVR